ncbi:MAG: hypothetical protein AB7U35_04370 [Sphingobium sp.]
MMFDRRNFHFDKSHRRWSDRTACAANALLLTCWATSASAQRTEDNAVTSAEDAFGVTVGSESIGLYNSREVRGFSPEDAGNIRLEGLYASIEGNPNSSLQQGSTVRVGMSALGYPFPAPTGIVDYRMLMPGGETALSVVTERGTFGRFSLELEGEMPIVGDTLGLAAGTTVKNVVDIPGQDFLFANFAIIPRWRPSGRFELIPFYSWSWRVEDSKPTIFVAGNSLPPTVGKGTFVQKWADLKRNQEAYGAISRFDMGGDTTLRAGLFRSTWVLNRSHTDFFRNTDSVGVADHSVVANPEQRRVAWSGEARLSKQWRGSKSANVVHLMFRGRTGRNRYGGSDSVSLGKATIGAVPQLPKPQFNFRPQRHDKVTQYAAGIGYEGRWRSIGEINLGLQRAKYMRTSVSQGGLAERITSTSWLYNMLAAINLTGKLAAYASYTKGLEENGTAPDSASNRGEPLPAVLTSQREAGLRYRPFPDVTVIAGFFDLKKPYYNLDSSGAFARLGTLRTRGVELSVAGKLMQGLNFVAGAALMDPVVEGQAVKSGVVGKYPASRTRTLVKLNLDYRPPFWEAFSVDLGVDYKARIAASLRPDSVTGKQLFLPARTEITLGSRYRFGIGGVASVLRVEVENLTDRRGWEATPSGGFHMHAPRRATVRLTADL